ncbi:glucose 1-dehydrogenase [Rhodococcus fascians]|nr:glucose 1-dehydrogenase [Rhodococcus fascians]MBY3995190.1 glucose 1-dehydrogenase [Rhodococcus fascians]MBY4000490.1 glucose 1-dehydrogenase [Rhodococcus fascians]MBY4005518.1 glucose 1-dehydrogenase [Rhodococcus fascians]MBY4016351.1 glucose 1-dehydrogenase [Rhodococcus fascians]
MKLDGSIAVITGAAGGIGEGIARRFLLDGAHVVMADLDPARLAEVAGALRATFGERVHEHAADVSSRADVTSLFESTARGVGDVDVLVNCAGIGRIGSIEHTTDDDWAVTMDVNLRSVHLCCEQVIPLMRAGGRGSIVNIASLAGLVGWPNRAAYSASKGGMLALTRAMAIDHAADRIRVNAIAPGVIETEMIRTMAGSDPDVTARRLAATPLGRFGSPSDIAYGAAYLASRESAFVTGHTLVIDGGWAAQ